MQTTASISTYRHYAHALCPGLGCSIPLKALKIAYIYKKMSPWSSGRLQTWSIKEEFVLHMNSGYPVNRCAFFRLDLELIQIYIACLLTCQRTRKCQKTTSGKSSDFRGFSKCHDLRGGKRLSPKFTQLRLYVLHHTMINFAADATFFDWSHECIINVCDHV